MIKTITDDNNKYDNACDDIDEAEVVTVEAPVGAGRLDRFLVEALPEISRSRIQSLIRSGNITLNGETVKPGLNLLVGGTLEVILPSLKISSAAPRDIALDIIYEDGDIIVVNKPQGMVVHPAAGHADDTLVNALMHRCGDLSGINGDIRPGIVHRIDKDTSGVLVAAKNDRAHLGLTEQWKGHNIKRVYNALLRGSMSEKTGTVDAPIGRSRHNRLKMAVDTEKGRNAVTHYRVLEIFPDFTFAELTLETGRTHQIRVHMQYLGHPVAGDPLYGSKKTTRGRQLNGQLLHAGVLGFKHPIRGDWMEFSAPLPQYMLDILNELRFHG